MISMHWGSFVEGVALMRHEFLCLVVKMSDQFLEQQIIKFCMKLGKNVTLLQCSPRLLGGKL